MHTCCALKGSMQAGCATLQLRGQVMTFTRVMRHPHTLISLPARTTPCIYLLLSRYGHALAGVDLQHMQSL